MSQQEISYDDFAIEHVSPRSAGGTDELSNLALSCQGCNNREYTAVSAIDPATGATTPLFHPRRDNWSEHFVWSANYEEILGLSAVARATISRLERNRPRLVRLRRALFLAGQHPPVFPDKDETG